MPYQHTGSFRTGRTLGTGAIFPVRLLQTRLRGIPKQRLARARFVSTLRPRPGAESRGNI